MRSVKIKCLENNRIYSICMNGKHSLNTYYLGNHKTCMYVITVLMEIIEEEVVSMYSTNIIIIMSFF